MTDFIDLRFRDHARVIATAVLSGRGGVALVDPGPASCLPALEAGLAARGYRVADVTALLLTHIHLDHAGATGAILERAPRARVFVHTRGARHLIDPGRLLASAARLYGDDMEALWGAFLPAPAERVQALDGGEGIDLAGRRLKVAYTPGHAQHHVSYLDEHTGVAFVGDTAGVRVSGECLIAPTPPPDIDLPAWEASLDCIAAWQPVALFLTHFGPATPAQPHLSRFREVLRAAADLARGLLERPGTDEERARAFADEMRRRVRAALPASEARATELAAPFEQLWLGLARYWRRV